MSPGEVVPQGRGTRWPWLIVVIAVGAVKVEADASLLHNRGAVIAVLAVGLLLSALRPKPVEFATVLHARQGHADRGRRA